MNGPVRVAVLDDYQGAALGFGPWSDLPETTGITVFEDHVANIEALSARLEPFPIILAMRERTPFPRALLARLPRLELLVTTGMGNASIDMAAAKELGILVTGTRGLATPTAELTWALILGLVRHVSEEDAAIRRGGWQESIGTDLAGATLGVIGLGRLGRQVAAIGQAFAMKVVAWSQNLDPGAAEELGVTAVTREELLSTADIVTVHLQLSERTRGLLGASELALMKPTAYLVNTSRGPIVDEVALLDALERGRIAGAGLDVFEVEPLPAGHPLRRSRRTLLTPHIGYVTESTYRIFFADAVADIAAFLAGSPIRVINAS